MKKKNLTITLGTDNFRKLLTTSDVFVDKTLFIKEIIDSGDEAILITRPRRWGKSLALDMLKTFLGIEVNENGTKLAASSNKVLFGGGDLSLEFDEIRKLPRTYIAQEKDPKYMKRQGQFPVIFISFKDAIGRNYSVVEQKITEEVVETFGEYRYLEKSDKLSDDEKEKFQECVKGIFTRVSLSRSIKYLSKLLCKHHDQKVYILVDEYDKPVNYFLEQSLTNSIEERDKVAKFVEGMLSECGKGNNHLQKIILTGIFDTLKKEGQSGFNNVVSYGIADIGFSKSFGFSEDETQSLISKLGFDSQNATIVSDNIKSWYNGYSVPIAENVYERAYTPWAVMRYLSSAYKKQYIPQSYWTESGASVILNNFIKTDPFNDLWNELRLLVQGSEVILDFKPSTSLFRHGNTLDKQMIFYLLLNSGYLTLQREANKDKFSIPNYEVRTEFEDVIVQSIEAEQNAETKLKLKNIESHFNTDIVTEIFSAVASNNSVVVKKLLDGHTQVKCNSPSYGMSFLHLAVLTGNGVLISHLQNYCGPNYQEYRDVSGLNILDYAYTANTMHLFKGKDDSSNFKPTLVTPGYMETGMCWWVSVSSAAIFTVTTTVTTFAKFALKSVSKDISLVKLFGTIWGTTAAAELAKDYLKFDTNYCVNYNLYNRVDISDVASFNLLKQALKYKTSHSGAYVTLDTKCEDKDEKVTELHVAAFKDESFPEYRFNILLCQKEEGFIESEQVKPQIENPPSSVWWDASICAAQLGTFGAMLYFGVQVYQLSGPVYRAGGIILEAPGGPLVAANTVAKQAIVTKVVAATVVEALEMFLKPDACLNTASNLYNALIGDSSHADEL